jgi:transcriptional regulator with XRE-family HTH domain
VIVTTLSDRIAANVRAERAFRRWSQQQLADRLGWSRTAVADLEGGRRRVGVDDLPLLCRAFGMTFAELASRAGPEDLDALGL